LPGRGQGRPGEMTRFEKATEDNSPGAGL
jgi:hypothetical protein